MALPIDPYLPDIVAHFRTSANLVLAAAPGAGKTTRVPIALWQAGSAAKPQGVVWVLQPRRLAARLAARQVAASLAEPVGHSVGYRVRFDDCTGPHTGIVYLTEGMLWRHLLAEPTLPTVQCVIFDEFHGRSLASDLALAALRSTQQTVRPDLRLVVMSATLDAEPIALFLGKAPILTISGRSFPVSITHLSHRDGRPLEAQVAAAVAQVCATPDDNSQTRGDILVFLPGLADIRRAESACQSIARAHGLHLLPLHGGLDAAAQDLAVRPLPQRKLILSTNVAETSVTLEGVTWVIDSGLAKQASQEPWSGVSRLDLQPISQAAATQRAGRAGRTQPGRCLRLYTAAELARRPCQATPEMARLDLTEAALWIAALGLAPLGQLPCLDMPPPDSLQAATTLLVRLGAVEPLRHDSPATAPWRMTPLGRQLVQLSAHPRLARLMLVAAQGGAAQLGCRAAALLGDTATLTELLRSAQPATVGPSDLAPLLHNLTRWPHETRVMAQQLERQLTTLLGRTAGKSRAGSAPTGRPARGPPPGDEALCWALLAGFPDRVARRMPPHGIQPGELALQLAAGGRASLGARSQVRNSVFVIAVHAQIVTHSTQPRRVVQLAEATSPEMLFEWGGAALADNTVVVFNEQTERVEATSRLTYDGLVLQESRLPTLTEAAAPVLLQAATARRTSRGWSAFVDLDALACLRGRLEVAGTCVPACAQLHVDDQNLQDALAQLCHSCMSFAELRAHSPLQHWLGQCSPEVKDALARLAPLFVRLASGRRLDVTYAPGHPPRVSSRLQDFFGCAEGPHIAAGTLPLTLHLLAPNGRPVQVTQDLSGFWERHYPALKKQLSRRYPRHAWPDNPRHAPPRTR